MIKYMITHPLNFLSKAEYTRWVYKGKGRPKFVKEQIKSTNQILNVLKSLKTPIIYVPGNVDTKEVEETIKSRNDIKIYYLDREILNFKNISILGVGGSLFTPEKYSEPLCEREYSFNDFTSRIDTINIPIKLENDFKILLTHEPPSFKIKLKNRLLKGGAPFFSDIIADKGINLSIFGHWHEFPICYKNPNTERIYLNPGPLGCYYFAIVDINNKNIEVIQHRLKAEKIDFTNIIYSIRKKSDILLKTLRFT